MAKIDRYDGNLLPFASNSQGGERTIFGSATQSDELDDNINADFLRGWENGTDINGFPTKQFFNAAGYSMTALISYLHQIGIPEWNISQEFNDGSFTNYNGVIYISTEDDNIGNQPDISSEWTPYSGRASFGSISDLKDISYIPTDGQVVDVLGYYSSAENMNWEFQWVSDDLSSEVTSDPLNGIYVAPDFDSTGATGAWVRLYPPGTVHVEWWGTNITPGVTDMSTSIQAAIDYVSVIGRSNPFPDPDTVKAKVKASAGEFYIGTTTINITSYIILEGAGKQLTRLTSAIDDGSKIINIEYSTPGLSQNYVEIKNLTVNGDNLDNIGIYAGITNRLLLDRVQVMQCTYGGLVMYQGVINTIRNCEFWGNGDSTHDAVLLDGPAPDFGPNATNFYGGEIYASGGVGIHIVEAVNVNILGMAIQSNTAGPGIQITNGLKIQVDGCYFEQNKGDILCLNGVSNTYTNNIFTLPITGYNACIVINKLTNGEISLNEFQVGINAIGETTSAGSLLFDQCHVGNNFGTNPLPISSGIMALAANGTIIERWDGTSDGYAQYGKQIFKSAIKFDSTGTFVGSVKAPSIELGAGIFIFNATGSPEGVFAMPPGSLCVNQNGGAGTTLYVKETGTGNTGWVAK